MNKEIRCAESGNMQAVVTEQISQRLWERAPVTAGNLSFIVVLSNRGGIHEAVWCNITSRSSNKKIFQLPLTRAVLAVLFIGLGIVAAQITLQFLCETLLLIDPGLINLLARLLFVPATCIPYHTYVNRIEQRPVIELSRIGAVGEVSRGVLLGITLCISVISTLWLLGSYHVTGVNSWPVVVAAFAGAGTSAFVQENMFRCSIFRIAEEVVGTWWALALSALFFGVIHAISPAATITSTIGIILEGGILLGAAYMLTRRLWFVMGIHAAWDFANDGIFGVAVSGTSGKPISGLLQAHLDGPKYITGGAFGVEASIIALMIFLAVAVYLLWRAQQQNHIVQPIWYRRRQA